MENILENNQIKSTVPAILLIDASGSVLCNYETNKTVINRIQDYVKTINADNFRMIFWNSNNKTNENFKEGILKLMYVINKSNITQPFLLVKSKINTYCLTFPHLGFDAISKDWINNTEPTHIYFITDGQMGYNECNFTELNDLKKKLKNSIENLFKTYNNIHLHLITVENKNMDFNNLETMQIAAGGDVFKVIQENNLTKFITEFISFTPNNENGYKHINTIIPPPGCVPFNDGYFHETKTGMFIGYLTELVKKTTSENDLLKIVQNLTATIRTLTKDKPQNVVDNIINTFCNVFKGTLLDPAIINFILVDTIKLEQQGKAIVFAEYKSKLKNLYKEANNMLLQNVKNSIGLTTQFITLPIDNKIIIGDHMYVKENIKLIKKIYPLSSIKINNLLIPAVPFNTNLSQMNEQCLRQFIRAIISEQYRENAMDDIIIYIVMALMTKVVLSDINEEYKHAYRNLAEVMLKKKRSNSEDTELARLERGELPIPNNGKIETFYGYMNKIKHILGLKYEPMTLHLSKAQEQYPRISRMTIWYILCLAFGNKEIIIKQLLHCHESINKDFGKNVSNELLKMIKLEPVEVFELLPDDNLDYHCLITLDDTTKTGGFKINSHISITGQHCCPQYVLSATGYNSLMEQSQYFCPICYVNLKKEDFIPVGPKIETKLTIFSPDTVDPFSNIPIVSQTNNISKNDTSVAVGHLRPKTIGTLILMKGTVGSGKTTFAQKIQDIVEANNGKCINESTDKYCKTGMSIKDAINKVSTELAKVNDMTDDMIVVIIDSCGENNSNNNIIFGMDFSNWKKITVMPNYSSKYLKGYLAWSLRNVLCRSDSNENTNYWLNPVSAGIDVCVYVHYKKSVALFGKKNVIKPFNRSSVDSLIAELKDEADKYQEFLDKNMPIDKEIEKIISQIYN